jgi:hypothetical protein
MAGLGYQIRTIPSQGSIKKTEDNKTLNSLTR